MVKIFIYKNEKVKLTKTDTSKKMCKKQKYQDDFESNNWEKTRKSPELQIANNIKRFFVFIKKM